MNPYQEILEKFDSITLSEMEGVRLMNRTDTKYTFSRKLLPQFLEELKKDYKVLNIKDNKISRYETLYYDTNQLHLYYRHHSGELNRYKIRHRTYVDSSIGFLEVKFKNNKGRTIKDRIKQKEVPIAWGNENNSFLESKLPFDPKTLIPVIWVNYNRLTLVSKNNAERLTIDLDLEFKKDKQINKFDNLVIAEVKQDKKASSSFIKMMKQYHIREGSISKYCMAIATSFDQIKKNNFKLKLTTIHNIQNSIR